ncbi:MAG: coproporphyrinogen III oxidase family protein [Archangiaceae bacterium]|nr:coproporphyrinogen III oxidase family protein [Archangiaceae bacterium]
MNALPEFQTLRAAAERTTAAVPLDALTRLGVNMPIEDYYLIGTYPPLKAMAPAHGLPALEQLTETCNVYVHLPFCAQRCTFCHFAKEIRPKEQRVERYLSALHRELAMVRARVGRRIVAHTVYFGGGTPSYLSPRQIEALFTELRRHVDISAQTEVTFELHPSVIDAPDYAERLEALQRAGVNRWVFGVQSMDDRVLKKLNRGHDRAAVFRLLELLARRGLTNFSVDLMFGLPYQTLENWYDSLKSLLEAGVEKFNIFPLMFKQADPISQQYQREPDIFPDANARLRMHHLTEELLFGQGFRRGPLFYYSRSRTHSRQQESKFNAIEDVNLLPFGLSSFGFVGHTQYYNVAELDAYLAAIEAGELPVWRSAEVPPFERQRRAIMFALRGTGVHLAQYRARYGVDPLQAFASTLQPYLDHGLLEVRDGVLALTGLGVPFADGIALGLVSDDVKAAVRRANRDIVDARRDLLDRYDFSPIEREAVRARPRVALEAKQAP